jgi:hypothetical protein
MNELPWLSHEHRQMRLCRWGVRVFDCSMEVVSAGKGEDVWLSSWHGAPNGAVGST